MAKVDLSIIIPSFNTRQLIINCLDSVIKYTSGVNYEIIIVDNGSTDGSVEDLKKYSQKNPQVAVIDVKENLGFGKANNLGAKNSKGEYLLFLNSDTLLFDNALKQSIDTVKTLKKLGVFSCKLLNKDKTFQASGGYFPNLFNVFAWQLFIDDLPIIGSLVPSFHPKQSAYNQNREIDWVTGAFMIIPRSVFDQVGGFDENIFMYTEEMELDYRIKKAGLKVYYQNTPAIIHLGGASSGSYLALTSEIKNMIYFWNKHKPKWQVPLIKTAFILGSLLRWLLFGIIKKDETRRRAYSSALRDLI